MKKKSEQLKFSASLTAPPIQLKSTMKAKAMSIEPDIAYKPVGIESNGKKAHTCCGCCCDMRRAVIVVDILLFIEQVLDTLDVESTLKTQLSRASFNVRDDTTVMAVDHDEEVTVALSVILFFLLAVWCNGLSLYGAITYNKYLVAVNATFLIAMMPLDGMFSIVVYGLFFYPHAFLIFYIHTGVITKENYENEDRCCCCV